MKLINLSISIFSSFFIFESVSIAYAQDISIYQYKSIYSIDDFAKKMPDGIPALELNKIANPALFDRSKRTVVHVSIDQTPDNSFRTLPKFVVSSLSKWDTTLPIVPDAKKISKIYAVPKSGVRIPVYYTGWMALA